MNLMDKIALVTGSAHRVGKHIALALAEEGCHIVVHFHHSDSYAIETVQEVGRFGVRGAAVQADLSHHQGVVHLFDEVDRSFDGLDILVNSAANFKAGDILKLTEEDWDQTIDLNLKGAFFCLQQAAQRMNASGGGAIVNISDIIGRKPWPRYPIHSISKAGIEMLTKVAALALAPEIRVNAVAPGYVLRPEGMAPERWESLVQDSPLEKSGSPYDVAQAVIFLLKNEYVTGEILVVDGGMQFI